MIRTILKLAFRNLAKDKLHSVINIAGLAIGFAAFTLIGLYLIYEYSWDRKNTNYEHIYRIQERVNMATGLEYWTQTPAALANHMRENYPEVKNAVLLTEAWGEFLSASEVRPFFEEKGYYAEPNIFDIFNYDFIAGDMDNALANPYSIVLSDSLAAKLFPKGNALGNYVKLEKKFDLKVTGIYHELPFNSSIRPSYIIPFALYEKSKNWENVSTNWTSFSFQTFLLLKNGTNIGALENKITHLMDEKGNDKGLYELYLLPLSDVYLTPSPTNSDYMVAIFLYGLIAVFILLLASVNFVNLTTANSSTRAREIGVKKVCGSSRKALIAQFLGESVVISLLAMDLAFVIVELFLPVFNNIIGRRLEFSLQEHAVFALVLLGIATVVGLLSGIYPAFYLSSFKTIEVLKSNPIKPQGGKTGLRKILVTLQLFISVFLIISTLMVLKQIHHMMSLNLGFKIENIIYARFRSDKQDGNIDDLRNRLLRIPNVRDVSISTTVPFGGNEGRNINWEGSGDEKINTRINWIDDHFINTFNMKILQGRNFLPGENEDTKECLINETALKIFGWKDPIGKTLYNNQYRVTGVVKDFYYHDMHNKIQPFIMLQHSGKVAGDNAYSILVSPDNILQTRKAIIGVFDEYFPDDVFEFGFLKDQIYHDFSWKAWGTLNKTFQFFSMLAILISAIGLFGLISYTAKRRVKEMGVRKVFGAKPLQIYLLLALEYIPLLIISLILGSVAALFMHQFLPGAYIYHTRGLEFAIAWIITIIVVFLTISYQAMRVARSNPVDSLRYE